MKITLLHPSRNRASTADVTIAEWLGKRSGRHPIEYILSIDDSDKQIVEYRRLAERHGAQLIIRPNRNSVSACNQAARVATGDLLIMVSDDFGCPEGWDDALVSAMGDRRDVAIFVDDGIGAKTMTLPIIDRAFYERLGYVLFPGYRHMFCDNELEEVARRLGKLIEATQLKFPHRHYIVGAAPYDEMYRMAESVWGSDAHVYRKRQVCDFGLRPQTFRDSAKCAWLDLHYIFIHRPPAIAQGVARRLRTKFQFLNSIRARWPELVRKWKETLPDLRRFFRRRRFGQNNRTPENKSLAHIRTLAGRDPRSARLAVVVPFRESHHATTLSQGAGRAQQLTQFIDHMATFLGDIDYHIFVIEQSQDDLPFNKGYLMNVGFNLAAGDFDYFAFHDVDQLPTNPRNSYAYPNSPRHLCVVTDGHKQYRTTVGGVLLINNDDFVACNGWSNHYLGWGQEDDDMAARLRNSVGFSRPAEEVGTYKSMRHPRVPGLDATYQFQRNRSYLLQCAHAVNSEDGFRDATFAIESRTALSSKCTRCVVSIAGPSRRFGFHSYVNTGTTQRDGTLFEHGAVRSQIVSLRDCVIDRTHVKIRVGGEEMPLQPIPEEQEFAVFEPGALLQRDPGALDPLRLGGYQRKFLSSAAPMQSVRPDGEESRTTFVVERREYVNLYHTLIELFNAYVAIQLLAGSQPFDILLLDGHCRGSLDPLWAEILKPRQVHRLHDYSGDTIGFKHLVLVPGGYDSPLFDTGKIEPSRFRDFLSDFSETVLAAYPVADRPTWDRVLTFIDRRDYKPHPRSDGVVCRKVDDLDFTVDLLTRVYPQHRVQIRAFEDMPFAEQLRVVRESDVLCGVHGAALVHVLFMRKESELVEFSPREFRRNDIFENLARLKAIRYSRYQARTQRVLPQGKLVVKVTNQRA